MDDPCAPKTTACGGDPSGIWAVEDACRDPAFQNPEAITYKDQAQTMARQPPPEPTSSDWCSYLMYDPTLGITKFIFPSDTLAVSPGGTITYDGSGTYAAKFQVVGRGSVDLSASCLSRFAVAFQCAEADPATLPAGARSLTNDLKAYSISLGSPAQNIVCADDGNLGCACTYELASEPTGGGLSGRWSTQGPLLTHFADTLAIPTQADLCVGTDTMSIAGHDRTWIWAYPGLRTVTLVRKPPDMSN
jgi:hypothetical protein